MTIIFFKLKERRFSSDDDINDRVEDAVWSYFAELAKDCFFKGTYSVIIKTLELVYCR